MRRNAAFYFFLCIVLPVTICTGMITQLEANMINDPSDPFMIDGMIILAFITLSALVFIGKVFLHTDAKTICILGSSVVIVFFVIFYHFTGINILFFVFHH